MTFLCFSNPVLLCSCFLCFIYIFYQPVFGRNIHYNHVIIPNCLLLVLPDFYLHGIRYHLFLENKSCCHLCQATSCTSSTPIYFSSCHFVTKSGLWCKIQNFLGLQLDHPLLLCTFKYRGKVLFCISNYASLQQKSFVRTSL